MSEATYTDRVRAAAYRVMNENGGPIDGTDGPYVMVSLDSFVALEAAMKNIPEETLRAKLREFFEL